MSAHTPGPWTIRALNNNGGVYSVQDSEGHEKGRTRIHDARLIAAAPELLEALRLIASASQGHDWAGVNQCARAAIAKATGGKP